MIDKQQAQHIALTFIKSQYSSHEEIVILDKGTIERPYGWIFFYDSAKYLKTQDMLDGLFDNNPVVVLKADGRALSLRGGGAFNLSEQIVDFELHYLKRVYELPEELRDEEPVWDEPFWTLQEQRNGVVH